MKTDELIRACRSISMVLSAWKDMYDLEVEEEKAIVVHNRSERIRAALGIFRLSLVLTPIGVSRNDIVFLTRDGHWIWKVFQLHLFGLRVARWVSGEPTFYKKEVLVRKKPRIRRYKRGVR